MSFLGRILGGTGDRERLLPLYNAIVAEARRREWYTECEVPDTIDGRFDMVALILCLVLFRFEAEDERARGPSALLTEVFIDDMDGTMREIGFGDLVVGKQVGHMMSALGGRLGAYRDGVTGDALVRNLYRGVAPAPAALAAAGAHVAKVKAGIDAVPYAELLGGRLA